MFPQAKVTHNKPKKDMPFRLRFLASFITNMLRLPIPLEARLALITMVARVVKKDGDTMEIHVR